MSEVTISIPSVALRDLVNYLMSHEQDIALCINDFGQLTVLFFAVIGKEADVYGDERLKVAQICTKQKGTTTKQA